MRFRRRDGEIADEVETHIAMATRERIERGEPPDVTIKHTVPGRMLGNPYVSFPNYRDYASQSKTVRNLVGWADERLTVGLGSGTYAHYGALVTPKYFKTMGVTITMGRALHADDDGAGDGLVVVISDRFWRERLANAADAIGRAVTINGNPATIVGVTAPGFRGATLTPESAATESPPISARRTSPP